MKLKQISIENALLATEKGEFSDELIKSKDKVAIVLTQDWCPQWSSMQGWMEAMEENSELDIYYLEYNTTSIFLQFMDYKENYWGNNQVPYVRYYSGGKLISQTNYVGKGAFLSLLGLS